MEITADRTPADIILSNSVYVQALTSNAFVVSTREKGTSLTGGRGTIRGELMASGITNGHRPATGRTELLLSAVSMTPGTTVPELMAYDGSTAVSLFQLPVDLRVKTGLSIVLNHDLWVYANQEPIYITTMEL